MPPADDNPAGSIKFDAMQVRRKYEKLDTMDNCRDRTVFKTLGHSLRTSGIIYPRRIVDSEQSGRNGNRGPKTSLFWLSDFLHVSYRPLLRSALCRIKIYRINNFNSGL